MALSNRINLPQGLVISVVALSAFISKYIIIPYLFPELFAGIAGRAASLFSITIYTAAILTIILNVFRTLETHKIKAVPYLTPLLLYIILGVIVNLYAPRVEYSKWGFIVITLPVLYMVVTNNVRDYTTAEIIIVFVVIGGTIVSTLMTFTDPAGKFPSLGGVIHHRGSAYFLGQSLGPVALATISGLSLTCAIVMQASSSHTWTAKLMILTFPFLFTALVVSGGRMAILATIISLLITRSVKKNTKRRERLTKFFFVIGTLVFGFIFVKLFYRYNSQILERIIQIPSSLLAYKEDPAISERISVWSYALRIVKKHPFGIGFDEFFNEFGLTPHSEFLNILLGAGIQGFLAFSIFIFLVLRRCYLGAKTIGGQATVPLTTFSGGIFMFLVSFTGAWTYSNTVASVMIWMIIATGVSVSYDVGKRGK